MGPRQRRARGRAKTHAAPVILVSVLGFLLVAGIAFGIGMLGNVERWLSDLPDYTDADEYLVSEPSHILDAAGNEIATFFVQNRESVTADQVSPWVLKGTVDVEDERFYEHPGVDIIGIGRAVLAQLSGRSEGASTITQQLVRNTILSEEQFDQTIERKVREAFIALEMEKIYSKDEILMMYLNCIYYGHGAYGIQAASKTYLSKNASDLTLAEAALLIGLPNSPSYYDPTVNPEVAVERRNKVLGNMLRLGTITQEEHDAAVAEPLALNVTEVSDSGITVNAYPYFVDYVKTLLQEEFSTDVLFKGGLTIKTTIDPVVQAAAENAAVSNLNNYAATARENMDLDIGMTVIDPKTGAIKAMVGGRDYNRVEDDGSVLRLNHATARQQPGSSFKPFTLAAAIEQGMNPNITLNCNSPLTWKIAGQADYRAQNYGNQSLGYISLARATELSSNTGYLQVAETIGNQNIIAMCKKLGLDTSQMEDVLTMTLGTGSFSTIEMASAYATFANGGTRHEPIAISEIVSRTGETVFKADTTGEQAISPSVASAVTGVLEGVMTNGLGAPGNPHNNQPVAGKTGTAGTADSATALWFCGYTPQYAAAIWVGGYNGTVDLGSFMGDQLTLPVFRSFMKAALDGVAREEFPTADAPKYKNNSEWKFSKTKSEAERATEEDAKTEEEKKKAEEEAQKEQEQQTPTTPESGNGSTGGGSNGGTSGGTGDGNSGGNTGGNGNSGNSGGNSGNSGGNSGNSGGGGTGGNGGTGGGTGGGTTPPTTPQTGN